MNLDLIQLINQVFEDTTVKTPPMTLRSGNAVDSYDLPIAYDEQLDQPTDEYLQHFAKNSSSKVVNNSAKIRGLNGEVPSKRTAANIHP